MTNKKKTQSLVLYLNFSAQNNLSENMYWNILY